MKAGQQGSPEVLNAGGLNEKPNPVSRADLPNLFVSGSKWSTALAAGKTVLRSAPSQSS